MAKDNIVYLRHILDSIVRIESYLENISEDDFYDSHLLQDGAVRQLEIIGEAVRNLSPDSRDEHSDIPWRDITGMRDKLIHDYMGVDLSAVWDTVQNDLPPLKTFLKNNLEIIR